MKNLATFLGGFVLVSCAQLAHGAIQISYSINGAAPVVCVNSAVSAGPISCNSISGSGVTVNFITASSNSPGTANLSQTFGSTLQISNGAAATLDVWLSSQDFSQPVTPPALTFAGSLSTTSTTGIGTVDASHCLDTNNGLTPPTTAFCGAGPLLNNTQEAYNGASSDSQTAKMAINSLTAPFAMSEHIHIVLGANSNLNVITSSVLTPVPEPMSVALFGGVILLTSGLIRRKRNQASQL
jgi:hypothetical protein